MASTDFHHTPDQRNGTAGIHALAAEIKALAARRHAHTEALVRLSVTPGVAQTLTLFR